MTGSWKDRGNQYIQFVSVLYCKLPTNGKQLPAFPLEAVPGTEPWPQRWGARVLPLWPPILLFIGRIRNNPIKTSTLCYHLIKKSVFSQDQLTFVGHRVGKNGITAEPDKIDALLNMKELAIVSEVRRFLGMVNQLAWFSPQLAYRTKTLRDLLSPKNNWAWDKD